MGVVVFLTEGFDGVVARTVGVLHDPVDEVRGKIYFAEWLSDVFY